MSEENTENMSAQLPDTIDRGGSNATVTHKQLKSGFWAPAEVVSVTKSVVQNAKKNIVQNIAYGLIDAEGHVIHSPLVIQDYYPPLCNPLVPGHKKPDTLRSVYFLALTFEDSFPRKPHKGKGGLYETAEGETISPQEAKVLFERSDKACQELACDYYDKPAEKLIGKRCYVFLEAKQAPNGKTYTKVEKTRKDRPNRPEDIVVEDGNYFDTMEV
jgi:hypothetical protein